MTSGAELDDLLHVSRVLLGVRAEGASVGVRVHGVVHATLQERTYQTIKEKVQFRVPVMSMYH